MRHIAIILSDILQSIGLQSLLSDYFPPVNIDCYHSFEALANRNNDTYDYFFTSSEVFILNADYFLPRRNKTMILIETENQGNATGGYYLYTKASQEILLEHIQYFFTHESTTNGNGENNKELSLREIDVLQLIVKGITNKEIADKLNISLNTVLTHRKNITAKLGIKTVSGLTFYAIMNGFISGEEIGI